MITLTVKQIADLAGYAGLVLNQRFIPKGDDLETEYTVMECPPTGTTDYEGKVKHYAHIAYVTDYPDDGVCPLGDEVPNA
jgi:hypothetical protein